MTTPPNPPIIVWFRDDLRLSDHPALHAAAKAAAPVIGLFVLDEASPGLRPLGGATRWWLAQSLRALEASLQAKGASLVLRQGPAAKVAADVAREAEAAAVFWNEIAHEPHRAIARQLEAALAKPGLETKSFPGGSWFRQTTSATRRVAAFGYSHRSGAACWRWATRRHPCPRLSHCVPQRPSRAIRSTVLGSSRVIPTGPVVCARLGRRARMPR
jgi:deoxyribodipyrimidine photo-lyase